VSNIFASLHPQWRSLKAIWARLSSAPEDPQARAQVPSRSQASSFHLLWRLPPEVERGAIGLAEVSAVLEVLVPPQVPSLYFWALQVDFVAGHRVLGGAHVGLQWNARYPGNTAANWGGYAALELGGRLLPGSRSWLPGFPEDSNTLAYTWLPGLPYRLRVFRSAERELAWRAEVTDLASGEATIIRDLYLSELVRRGPLTKAGVCLGRPLVWSEVFASCDAPSVRIRWSDLRALTEEGRLAEARAVLVNYQAESAGGCRNTDSTVDEAGFLQTTNTRRTTPQGSLLTR